MELRQYFEKIDRIVLRDVKVLTEEVFSFLCVLIIVPFHIALLLLRIMIPWLVPILTKEDA